MYREITYKEQGDGSDSWVVTEWETDKKKVLIDKQMVYNMDVENWKLKSELHDRGLLTQVEGFLDALSEPIKTKALLGWNYSNTISFGSSACDLIRQSLQLTKEQVLEIFFDAKDIRV